MVLLMIVVGGITRLTHSGLSITEWQPLVGTLPPLNESDWQVVFDKYKLTPEYKLVNHAMTLDEFKGIFWWEYFHRLLGRLIGVVFLLPLVWFAVKRRIDGQLALRLGGIFLLGGLQGAMGWYMVKSGLVDNPRVSQFRLTAHLSLAFAIFGAMFWTALGILYPRRRLADTLPDASLARMSWWLTGIVCYMVVAGGFVASLARPGGNMTGFTPFEYPIAGKWLALLKQAAPGLSRVALMGDPNNHNYRGFWGPFETTAQGLAIQPLKLPVGSAAEIEKGLEDLAAAPGGGVVVSAATFSLAHRELIFALTARLRLPAIYWTRFFAATGGLMSYGPDTDELYAK